MIQNRRTTSLKDIERPFESIISHTSFLNHVFNQFNRKDTTNSTSTQVNTENFENFIEKRK